MPVAYSKETPSQTAGPYVHIGTVPALAGLPPLHANPEPVLRGEGEALLLSGHVLDGAGAPLRDALLEAYQADGAGRLPGQPGWRGWARMATDGETGVWALETVRPAALPWRGGRMQAPHISLLIFARGINIHLHTRVYFPEDDAAHGSDPALMRIEQPARRQSLIASLESPGVYRFDIRLQGEGETVFFDM